MRRTLRFLAAGAAALVLLAGCSTATDDATGSATWNGRFPAASGEFGDKPVLTFPSGEPPADLQVTVLAEGDGPEVASGDFLVGNYLGQVWGGSVFDNSYDRGQPSLFGIGIGQVIPGWDEGLVGQRVGSRVLLVIPPEDGYGSAGNSNAGIEGDDTIVFVVDLIGTYDAGVSGQADATPAEPLPADGPQVSGDLGGPATVTIPEGAAEPTAEAMTVIATGTGEPVTVGVVLVQYMSQVWSGSDSVSTWTDQKQPVLIPVTDDGSGMLEPLVGTPVGSRVLLTIPATDGGEALAVVLDVVAQVS